MAVKCVEASITLLPSNGKLRSIQRENGARGAPPPKVPVFFRKARKSLSRAPARVTSTVKSWIASATKAAEVFASCFSMPAIDCADELGTASPCRSETDSVKLADDSDLCPMTYAIVQLCEAAEATKDFTTDEAGASGKTVLPVTGLVKLKQEQHQGPPATEETKEADEDSFWDDFHVDTNPVSDEDFSQE